MKVVRPWLPALAFVALFALFPESLAAQETMFKQATKWVTNSITIVGYIMILGGLLLVLAGGWGVKEQRGGWAAIAVGCVITFVGFRVSAGTLDPTQIFGN
jgi:hypothetical protein